MDVVGVTRPPPTAELKPMSEEGPTAPPPGAAPPAPEAAEAARESCASEEPPRFRFCRDPIPRAVAELACDPYNEKGFDDEELINCPETLLSTAKAFQ